MKYAVVLPAYNEEDLIEKTLQSLFQQTHPPQEVVVVDDQSTDTTAALVKQWAKQHSSLQLIQLSGAAQHQPGAKVVHTFLKGVQALTQPYDVLVKLDADIVLPQNYFSELAKCFKDKSVGIAGGMITELKQGQWEIDHPMNEDHVRGAIKAYSKACYQAIGGLRPIMGWDTLDEHLARFYTFKVVMLPDLLAKHYRPLGRRYAGHALQKQGQAFYLMRYGLLLSLLALLKHAWVKQSIRAALLLFVGYLSSLFMRPQRAVTKAEGRFIRRYRYAAILSKLKSF